MKVHTQLTKNENRKRTNMKLLSILAVVFALMLVVASSAYAQQKAGVLFQSGLYQEQVKGDLDAAIKVYERIIINFPKNRPVVAKALLHIGLCYEKLGKQEAQKAYQRVIRGYADQHEVVAEAKTRLSRLTRLASAVQAEDIVIRKFMDASGAGFHGGGEPSPDGKYFCFVDWETYPNDIVIKEIGTGEEIRLRNKIDLNYEGDVGTPYFPTWSPDSKKIAYTWESDEGLYIELRVIEIDNPKPDVLIRVSYFKGWVTAADWSPDGQHILVLLSENDQDQLGLISIVDSSFHLLKKFDYFEPTSAKFSPDGHHIAYDLPPNKESTNHDIYVLSIDGRREIKLTSHPSHDYLLDWSPTGKKILFASDRTGTKDVWSISFDEGAPQGEPKLITENIGLINPLGCTRNGSFYFSTPGSWWDIYTVTIDPETGKIVESPAEVPLPYQGYNKHPALSPNGKYLAYISMRGHLQPPRDDILCIYTIETGKVQEFDHDISIPRWFPDSQSILVNDTHVLKIDTGEITPFIQEKEGQAVYSPSIPPDKKYLYYVRGDKNSEINSIISRDLKTGKEKELYHTPDDSITTALSPDGKQLALLSRHKENTRILKILSTMNGSEKDIHKFKLKEYRYISTAWSPDGRYIYFSKRTDSEKKWGLWRIPATGGTAENLGVKMQGFASLSIHPDGRRITFASFVGLEKSGGIWVMENFLPKIEPKGIILRQVWAGPDVDILGAPSPDGRYLSYVDWEIGDLAIYEIATGKKRRLTNKGSWEESHEFAESSRWSPDSKNIAYSWFNKDETYDFRIIGLDGSKPRILYSNKEVVWVKAYDWSTDGTQILACFKRKDWKNQMVLFSTADGSVRVLKTMETTAIGGGMENMKFSPDGRYIVYSYPPKEDSPERDISLLTSDGSREISLVEHPADDYVLGWAPDGKNILFASDRTGTLGIWLIAVADGKPQGVPELVNPDIGRRFLPLGFTRKGSFYYGIKGGLIRDVYFAELDPETGKILAPPEKAIKHFEGSNSFPEYSPDGKYLSYISRRPPITMIYGNQPYGNILCIRSLETGEEHEFRPKKINGLGRQRWSPDCRSLLVRGRDNKNGYGIFRIDAQTGDVKPFVLDGDVILSRSFEWSRDGKAIFYARNDRKAKIYKILVRDLESGTEKEIYLASDDDRLYLSCSPDGKWLAFVNGGEKGILRIMPTAGGEPRELLRLEKGKGFVTSIPWTADGKYILFAKLLLGQINPKCELFRISADGGEPQKLGLEMNQFFNLSVQPDGRHIAFSSVKKESAEVWVMENFLPESKVGE